MPDASQADPDDHDDPAHARARSRGLTRVPPEHEELPLLPLRVRVTGRHPRFYRKMVGRPDRATPAGSLVRVVDKTGAPVGTGFFNPRTNLALRIVTHGDEPVDEGLFVRRLGEAVDLRERVLRLPEDTNAYRLVHGEGDRLPGFVLDKLGRHLVGQVHALGIVPFLEPLGLWLKGHYPESELTLTVDPRARELEGIDSIPPAPAKRGELTEWGVTFGVRPGAGHKTGFFCDQRDNRRLLATLVDGKRVLDLCCNTGGFTLVAARHGAPKEVVGFDLDEDVVQLARENARRNRLAVRFEPGDLFDVLRSAKRGAADVIVLDPPKWADSPGEVDAALRRYGDANRLAMAALAPGGMLLSCSCSGSVSEERFLACLAGAAAAAGADAQVLAVRGAGPDHPVALECPETRYLKAVLLRMR